MPYLTLSNLPVYTVSPLLMLLTGVIMWRRGWIIHYPSFFALLCLKVLSTAVFLPMAYAYSVTHDIALYRYYFYSYWGEGFVEVVLVFVILYRLFAAVFSGYSILSRWSAVLYMMAMIGCLLIAIYVTPSRVHARGFLSIAVPLWQSTLIFSSGMLAFLFLVVFGIGIRLRDYLFGIAAGLGLNAVINLLNALVSVKGLWWFTYGTLLADLVAACIWFAYLFVSRKVPPDSTPLSGSDEISPWKDALTEFLHK